ncbi:outer membrane protein TolC [Winogradskyella epiphytica]|uniref:Outer membrane protein TolC n=1 Tax=Winogradskyella epiphytica TaxID=262005 RepID=A0A2V4X0W3_9FLAO|nr:TolC family protein [Winogradskyella epiphytica]PYE83536.1 outer membrane protein TolC [Winogradskyella epiphytica]GGW58877.1 transporter [Winogradskyella epiphytica]
MTKTLRLLIGFLIVQIGFSQEEPSALSLQEAIHYALENNRTALNAARDIEAAKQKKWETTATGLPQINASVDYQNFLKQQVQVIPAEFFGGNPGEFQEVVFGTKQSVNATATLSQKIFDGSYLVALQSAKVFLEISKNAKTKTDLEVRKSVIDAYGNVLLAEESVEILNRNIDVLEKNLFETTKIYENGLGEEENVEQLQITLSGVKSSLNNTNRLKTLAYQMLNITLGLDVYKQLELTDDLETLAENNRSLALLEVENNPETSIDYIIAANDTKAKELLVKLEKSKALPTFNTFINGGYSAFENDFTFFNSDQKWFGSSLFGVSLNIPIFSSGMRSAATQRAQINLEKSVDDLTETAQRIKLQIASAKSDYQFAIEDYENKKQNLALAERIETKNQTKFFEGIGSSFELRQAQTQLYTAQQELLQAMLDVINSKAALETILNTPIK